MRLLIDTHAFLWVALDDSRVSARARAIVEQGADTIYLSASSALEIAIKSSIGRMDLPESPATFVANMMTGYGLVELPVSIEHALRVADLPHIHGDPFDRLLVSQAQVEGLPILTSDPHIRRYDVETVW